MAKSRLTIREREIVITAALRALTECQRKDSTGDRDPFEIAGGMVGDLRKVILSARRRGMTEEDAMREIMGLMHDAKREIRPDGEMTPKETQEKVRELADQLDYPPSRNVAPSFSDTALKDTLKLFIAMRVLSYAPPESLNPEKKRAIGEFVDQLMLVARETGKPPKAISDEFEKCIEMFGSELERSVLFIRANLLTIDSAAQVFLDYLTGL